MEKQITLPPAAFPYKTLSVCFAALLVTLLHTESCSLLSGVCAHIPQWQRGSGKWQGREFVPDAQFSAFNKSHAVLLLVKWPRGGAEALQALPV